METFKFKIYQQKKRTVDEIQAKTITTLRPNEIIIYDFLLIISFGGLPKNLSFYEFFKIHNFESLFKK